MSLQLNLKINNQEVIDHISSIKILNAFPTLTWEFDTIGKVFVDSDTGETTDVGVFSQIGYEVKIGTSDFAIGTSDFIGDISRTGYITSQELFWGYRGFPLDRGVTYYGQVNTIDTAHRTTEFATFSFYYNSLPIASDVEITPVSPLLTDDLVLNYDYFDYDGDLEYGTTIRWFKNGIHQRQFDNALIINSSFLQNNDIWNVDIYPSDGFEAGLRVTSSQVKITAVAIVVSSLEVLPSIPNPDDILKANYEISDDFELENVLIRWYINNQIITDFNDEQFARLSTQTGDQVRFEIKHENANAYVSSSIVSVVSSEFKVTDIQIDGKAGPLDVSTITPHIKWKRFSPEGRSVNYISIRIGTFFESDNIYSMVISGDRNVFTIPPNILEKGRDYYIGIALSDTQTFNKYTTSHFRIRSSRWENNVSNSIGWTMEVMFITGDIGDSSNYQIIRINDGSRFAEIRLHNSKIVLISGSQVEYSISTTSNTFLTIAGQNDNIRIYLNRNLIINGEGIFTQESNIKRLEISHEEGSESEFFIKYKYVFYTTSGYFLPQISSEYTNLQFHNYIEFQENEVVALRGYVGGKYVFGINPNNENESSTIYSLGAGDVTKISTVAKTYSPVSKIGKSPDGTKTIVAHAKGASIITGYLINPFDHEMIFVSDGGVLNETFPNESGWELVQNCSFDAGYFMSDGLNINTLNVDTL